MYKGQTREGEISWERVAKKVFQRSNWQRKGKSLWKERLDAFRKYVVLVLLNLEVVLVGAGIS